MNAANAIAVKVIREALENPNREFRAGACTEHVHIGYDLQQQKWVYMCCDFRDTNCVFGIYTLIFSGSRGTKAKGWGQRDRL